MAILAPTVPLFALLSLELQADYRAMAAARHVTPDDLVVRVLEQGASDWKWSNRDRGLPPVVFPRPVSVLAVHTVRPPSVYTAIVDALMARGASDATAIRAWLTSEGRWRWTIHTLRTGLSELALEGKIRRVRQGVYARESED